MLKTLSGLMADALVVQNETGAGLNSKIRIATFFLNLLKLVPLPYDNTSAYEPGQQMYFHGRLFTCFQATNSGQSPETNPQLWQDSASDGITVIQNRADTLTTARDVGDYVDLRATQILSAPGGLVVEQADEDKAGIAKRASQAKVLAGTDNEAFVTAKNLAYALSEALRGLENYGWNDSTKIDPTTDSEITISNTANIDVVRLVQSLTVVERKNVEYLLTQLPNGTIAKTPIGGTVALSIGATYDQATHILTLTALNAVGDIKYSIPLLNIVSGKSATYTVPPALRSGAVTLAITGDTPTQTAKTEQLIPADPLGNYYISMVAAALNIGVGTDGIAYKSISTYLKGKGSAMLRKIVGRNGTVVPLYTDADVNGFRQMTSETQGYQKPDLFVGVAPYAGLDQGCGYGDYTISFMVKDHPETLITFDCSFTQSQSGFLLFQSTISAPEDQPEAPVLSNVVITIGHDFDIEFPPFLNAPVGSTYSQNYRPNGSEFNSSTRRLKGNVGALNEVEKDVQYYCSTPSGKVYETTYHLSVVSDTTPKIEKALGFFNDNDPALPGFAAHSIIIKTVNQPAGTTPQVGSKRFNDGLAFDQDIYWANCLPFSDASDFNWKDARQLSPFSPGARIQYFIRMNPASAAILLYDRDISDTPANRAQVIINYPTLSTTTPTGGGGSSADMDTLLGQKKVYVKKSVVGDQTNTDFVNLKTTISSDGLVRVHNDKVLSAPGGYVWRPIINGIGYLTETDQPGYPRTIPIFYELVCLSVNNLDRANWSSDQNYAPGTRRHQGSITHFKNEN